MGQSAAMLDDRFEDRIAEILVDLNLEEKVAMLSGHGFMEQIAKDGRYCGSAYHIGAGNERLGVPPLLFNDGPRGVAMGNSTCFPVPMARGASFEFRAASSKLCAARNALPSTSNLLVSK